MRLLNSFFLSSIISTIDCQIEHGRQTVLLSATLTKEVEKLAGLSLHDPVSVHVVGDDSSDLDRTLIIPDSLAQFYIIVPPKLRLVTLASLLLDKCSVRILKDFCCPLLTVSKVVLLLGPSALNTIFSKVQNCFVPHYSDPKRNRINKGHYV